MELSEEPSAKFTKEQVEDLREAFSFYEKDKSGKIAANEIGVLLRSVGQNYTDEELHDIIIDASEDNLISFKHFLEIMEKHARTHDLNQEICEAFKEFDQNGDGLITLEELKKMMNRLGERFTDEELEEMMGEADLNGDGFIDFKEFRLLLFNN